MEALKQQLGRVLEENGSVRLAYLFGSTARGETHAGSDVDVALLARPGLDAAAAERLTLALQQATGHRIDLVDLDRAPPLLLREVIATGQLLLCRSTLEQDEFELRAIARYLDTAHLRATQLRYLRQRVEAHRARQP